jgi:Holliday junction DNA helicase RuvA
MIGSLRGRLILKQAPAVIIECNGVGYDVETPMSTFLGLPPVGDELFLFTHLVVREDAQTLYGFATEEERTLFRLLLKISGVGAKIGLAIARDRQEDCGKAHHRNAGPYRHRFRTIRRYNGCH